MFHILSFTKSILINVYTNTKWLKEKQIGKYENGGNKDNKIL
jgi:hypothetical protein